MSSIATAHPKTTVSVRSVAMPAEHGGWGFLTEPLLLGLLVAPSLAGGGIAFAAVALFLLHQPLKIVLKDLRRGRIYGRTRLAGRFVLIYAAVAVTALAATAYTAQSAAHNAFWIPLLLALPVGALQFAAELRGDSRTLAAEITGALSLAAAAPAIILAAGLPASTAAAAWGLLALRAVCSILYVRAQLRLLRGKSPDITPPITAHNLSVLISAVLWAGGVVNGLALLATGMLMVRAVIGLKSTAPVTAKKIGFREIGFGLAYALLCALALR